MSPVLSSTARTFGIRRRRARQSTATLFPVSPYATSPTPRAGDSPGGVHTVHDNVSDKVEAAAGVGLGGSTSGYTTADCPPPTSQEAVPHGLRKPRGSPDPGCSRTAGGHCPPRSMLSPCGEPPQVRRAARVFPAAGEVHPEPLRFGARPVRLDDQSISRLRIRLPLLLRPLHARVHGAGRRRIRAQDFCEKRCSPAAGLRRRSQIFV